MNRLGLRETFLVVLMGAVVGVCTVSSRSVVPSDDAETTADLHNLTYHGIYDQPVHLIAGIYEGEPFVAGGASRPRVELQGDLVLRGDLNGDGADEQIVFLAASSGGTGTHIYVATVSKVEGAWRNTATSLVGDRVQVQSAAVEDGELRIGLVEAGPADPVCCPTRKMERRYRLRGDVLALERSEDQGELALADLAGVVWQLRQFGRDQPVPAGVAITAEFNDGKVAGSAGCNRYFAEVKSETGRGIRIGPPGTTRMACPDPAGAAETRFLQRLAAVDRFSFRWGQLALGYPLDAEHASLLFTSP